MATRPYARNGLAFSEPHLGALLDTALGLTGCVAKATETSILVTHASLTAANDAAVTSTISGYVFDPDYGIAAELIRLRSFYTDLLTWAQDAEGVDTGWTGTTYSAAKDAALRVLFRRMALLCRAERDLLFALNRQAG